MPVLHDFGARIESTRDLVHPVMLHPDFASIATAQSVESIEEAIQRFIEAIGFDRYAVVVMQDDFSSADSGVATHWIDNTPAEYQEQWGDCNHTRTDPVLSHCKLSGEPGVFDQGTYVSRGQGTKWECQAASGYGNGIAIAFHLPRNQHVLFGVDRFASIPKDGSTLIPLVAYTSLFATFVQTAVQGVFGLADPRDATALITRLSRRESECLQWAAEGKTAWETGMILSIAEATVVKILASAIRKLDCANKPQAVVKALRLRLIH